MPPVDAEIEAAIDAVGALAEVPRGDGWTLLDDDVLDAYLTGSPRLLAPGHRAS